MEQLWLLKLVTAHMLTDFVLQPRSWVVHRRLRHFASPWLYLHGLLTGAVAGCFIGWQYWPVAALVAVTHILIDGWKSYRPDKVAWFITDQALHLLVILACWYFSFFDPGVLIGFLRQAGSDRQFWIVAAALVFLTTPAGILIGQMTKGWREKLLNAETLENAGKWIGVIERLIVFILVMVDQYAAISLLIAAKGIIRFNEKDRPEVKTEYLVIGTLLSIGIAMGVAFAAARFIRLT